MLEIDWPELAADSRFDHRLLVGQWIGLGCMLGLLPEPLIAPPHQSVDNQCGNALAVQLLQIRFAMVTGIGRAQRLLFQPILEDIDHRDQQLMLAAGAVRLRFDDDLIFTINRCHTGVALNGFLCHFSF